MFPSWNLPHERLSPGVDTVGARMMLLRGWLTRRTAACPPVRVVVTAVRSLLQPMVSGWACVNRSP